MFELDLNIEKRNTIKEIIKESGIDWKVLKKCITERICNGCGPKGLGMHKRVRLLPNFLQEKYNTLLSDLRIACCIHDVRFGEGGGVKDFIKANTELAENVWKLLNWTKPLYRRLAYAVIWGSTTFLGWPFFIWGKKKEGKKTQC